MVGADKHLEQMLQEYNDKISVLEDGDDLSGLLDAYYKRGRILSMLGHSTSAMDDLMDASELIDDATDVDAGVFVGIHLGMASIIFEQGDDPIEEYSIAATRLNEVDAESSGFNERSIPSECATACYNLMEYEHFDETIPYIIKGLECSKQDDAWFKNRHFEILCISADVKNEIGGSEDALAAYTDAILLGGQLLESSILDDSEELVNCLYMRSTIEASLGMQDFCINDLDAAVDILESLFSRKALDDIGVLCDFHRHLSERLFAAGRDAEAETHLIRAMKLEIMHAV